MEYQTNIYTDIDSILNIKNDDKDLLIVGIDTLASKNIVDRQTINLDTEPYLSRNFSLEIMLNFTKKQVFIKANKLQSLSFCSKKEFAHSRYIKDKAIYCIRLLINRMQKKDKK